MLRVMPQPVSRLKLAVLASGRGSNFEALQNKKTYQNSNYNVEKHQITYDSST